MIGTFLRGATSASGPIEFVGGTVSSFSASSTPRYTYTGSLSGGLASSASVGDVVIACVCFKDATNRDIQCLTSGYTEVADLYANSINDSQMAVYFKVLSSPESDVQFNLGVSTTSRAAIYVWRGVDQTNPLDVTTTSGTSSATGRPDAPSITTITDKAVVIAVGAAAYGGSPAEGQPLTAPSGMTNFFTAPFFSSTTHGLGIASIYRPLSGFYNPPAFGGGSTSNSNSFCAATIALRPA
jgi:hypothetical protein